MVLLDEGRIAAGPHRRRLHRANGRQRTSLDAPQPDRRFLHLADENVRYLYNNWIGHLAQKEDRDGAVASHRESSRRMAERIARALETKPSNSAKGCCAD